MRSNSHAGCGGRAGETHREQSAGRPGPTQPPTSAAGRGCSVRSRAAPPTTSPTGWPQTPAWRDRIRYVAIDMCTVFVAAIRRYLPHATIVVDHFHVVKLANDTVAKVRAASPPSCAAPRPQDRPRVHGPQPAAPQPRRPLRHGLRETVEHPRRPRRPRPDDPEDLDRQGGTPPPARPGRHRRRPVGDLPPALPVLHLVADAAVPGVERLARTIETWWPASRPSSTPRSRMRPARATTGSSNSTPATPTATGTPRTNGYEHAAQPPAEPAMPQPRSTSLTR